MKKKVRVLILGKSNVGKSSLINCLVKEHNALVSSKLHSTRLSTFHEFNNEDYEVQLVDTPGVSISDGNLLCQAMKRNAIRFMTNSDMIIILTQPQKSYKYEAELLFDVVECEKPYLICVNKADLDYEKEFERYIHKDLESRKYSLISIKERIGIDEFLFSLFSKLNSIEKFSLLEKRENNHILVIQELIRESILNHTDKEIPYESAVKITRFHNQKNINHINAEIIVSKENHKKIILGKKGGMIKSIGIESREKIERLLKKKIHLSLFVLVKDNWKNNPNLLKEFGYID